MSERSKKVHIQVRLPVEVHEGLKARAKENGRSLNAEIISCVEGAALRVLYEDIEGRLSAIERRLDNLGLRHVNGQLIGEGFAGGIAGWSLSK